jgi:hypothetical protein
MKYHFSFLHLSINFGYINYYSLRNLIIVTIDFLKYIWSLILFKIFL